MSHILVPVDYSVNAKNAYIYALQLAERLRMNIKVLHVYNTSALPYEAVYFEGEDSIENVDEHKLRAYVRSAPNDVDYEDLQVPKGVDIKFESVINLSVAAGIRLAADEDDVDMIVMGTTNKTGVFVNWLGSTASQVSETAPKPVLLVPPKVKFENYRRIVVANHYETTEKATLSQITAWAELFGSALHFVHVVFPKDKSPHELIGRATTEQLLTMDPPLRIAFEVTNLKHESVADGLENYAEEQQADLLIVVNKKRSNWSALLRRSLTQRLALATKRPILIMHEEPVFWDFD